MKSFIHAVVASFLLATSAMAQVDISMVNINEADATTIARVLKGVGEAKAQLIVQYREAHGDFKALEELTEVKGIGAKLVQKNQDRIQL